MHAEHSAHRAAVKETKMIHGLFYIVAGALFAVYAVDLSWLIAVSLWARAQEVRSLCQPYDAAKHSPEARASKGSWLTFSGKKQQKAAKSPPSEAGSGSEMGAIGATLDRDSGSTSGRSASAEPSSPQENSSSGSSDAGSSSPQVTVKLSSLGEQRAPPCRLHPLFWRPQVGVRHRPHDVPLA